MTTYVLYGGGRVEPSWRDVVPILDRPSGGVGPCDDVSDIPYRATSQTNDRSRESRAVALLPHVDGVGVDVEHQANLFRACQEPPLVHATTVGRFALPGGSARRTPLPTEISYTAVGSPGLARENRR